MDVAAVQRGPRRSGAHGQRRRAGASSRHYRALLSADEHERMARFVFERDRRALPAHARAGAHHAVALRAGRAGASGSSSPTCTDGPEILDRPGGVPDLRFNISHTDGLIACAVTIGREVGVDVEHIDRHLTHDIAGPFLRAGRSRPTSQRCRTRNSSGCSSTTGR